MITMRNEHDDATNLAVNIDEIRLRAEELQPERIMQPPEIMEVLSIEAAQQLIHDLQAYQIEQARQNNELRRIQSELDEARSRYFDLYEFAPGGYFLLSEQGQIVEANSTFAALLGIKKAILIDQPLTRFICIEDQDTYSLHRRRLFDQGVTPACELRLIKGDDTMFWVRLEANLQRNANGTSMVRGMGLDITDLKLAQAEVVALNDALEERVRERTRQLEESNLLMIDIAAAKAIFLANMSHELRTPLNAVIGFSEVLQDQLLGPLNEKQAHYIANIVNSGQHLVSLVNDVLDLSKVESGKMELDLGQVNMADLCRESLSLLQGRVKNQGIELKCHIDIATDVATMVDGRKIKQILFNLVDNGIKFNRPEGSVTILIDRVDLSAGAFWRMVVEDTGIGIAADDLSKLFQPFFQLDSTYTKNYQGTGLGLALTKKLVEIHGGEINVESELGKWTRFIVMIPIQGSERE